MIIDNRTADAFERWITEYYRFELREVGRFRNLLRTYTWLLKRVGIDAERFVAMTPGSVCFVKDFRRLAPPSRVKLLMHEARHRCQNIGRERRFRWQYVFSRSRRADYEGDCMQLDIDFDRFYRHRDTIRYKEYQRKLVNDYLCSSRDAKKWIKKWRDHVRRGRNDADLLWSWFKAGKKR